MTIVTDDALQPLNHSITGESSEKTDIKKSPVQNSIQEGASFKKQIKGAVIKNKSVSRKRMKNQKVGDQKRAKRLQINRSIADKLKALSILHQGKTKAQVCRELRIAESTLRGWVKDEPKILAVAAARKQRTQRPVTSPAPSIAPPPPQTVPPTALLMNRIEEIRTSSNTPIRSEAALNRWLDEKIAEIRQAAAVMQLYQMINNSIQ